MNEEFQERENSKHQMKTITIFLDSLDSVTIQNGSFLAKFSRKCQKYWRGNHVWSSMELSGYLFALKLENSEN